MSKPVWWQIVSALRSVSISSNELSQAAIAAYSGLLPQTKKQLIRSLNEASSAIVSIKNQIEESEE